MSEPQDIIHNKVDKNISGDGSPHGSPHGHFLVPSPVPTRRTRTFSASERVLASPSFYGIMKSFCREKGHGFIIPRDGGENLFVHISDIDGEFVPKEGDEVSYKRYPIPPKNEKFSAVHVTIVHPKEGVTHERWDSPVKRQPSSPANS